MKSPCCFFSRSRLNLSREYENNNTARIGISFHLSPDPLPPALSNPQASNNPPPPGRREERAAIGLRVAGGGMTCSPIPMPCRSLAFARSLLLSDPQTGVAIAMCAVFVSSSSLTHSVRRFARLRSSRLFSSLLLLYTYSSRRACRMASGSGRCVVAEMRAVWHGVAMGLMWRWAI